LRRRFTGVRRIKWGSSAPMSGEIARIVVEVVWLIPAMGVPLFTSAGETTGYVRVNGGRFEPD